MTPIDRNPKPKRPLRTQPAKVAAPASHRSTPWHSVSIVTTSRSCPAAHKLRAARFLSATAPRLPLPDCTVGNSCPCAYKHHADRRGQPRRKEEITGLKRSSQVAQERRVTRSRREND
jgi:hypothetical protein